MDLLVGSAQGSGHRPWAFKAVASSLPTLLYPDDEFLRTGLSEFFQGVRMRCSYDEYYAVLHLSDL